MNIDQDKELSLQHIELQAAIETLYGVFARYPLRRVIAGCPCCVGADDKRQLHVRPVRELTADDLSYYAFKAMTTFGDVADFKHFLPRLCELLTDELHGASFPINDEILGGKIRYAGYPHAPEWPDDERAAVRAFLLAWWQATLAQYPVPDADTQFCLIAQCEDDLAPYLEAWLATGTPTALAQLAACVIAPAQSAWWDERPDQRRQVADFLSAPAINDHLALLAYRFRNALPSDLDPWLADMLRDLARSLD